MEMQLYLEWSGVVIFRINLYQYMTQHIVGMGQLWSWSYGSWIYNCLDAIGAYHHVVG